LLNTLILIYESASKVSEIEIYLGNPGLTVDQLNGGRPGGISPSSFQWVNASRECHAWGEATHSSMYGIWSGASCAKAGAFAAKKMNAATESSNH
ncbi:MAG: hypothetical protein QF902_00470, partial [Rhodospirillales bacterium]|nr:hypothetical protein [Rhodospirillales bacterium]